MHSISTIFFDHVIFSISFTKMMQDVENYGIVSKDRKEAMLKDRLLAYLAILLTLVAFICSCVGLNMGRQVLVLLWRYNT